MNGEVSHRAYYAQFVTPAVKAIVSRRIGIEDIRLSTDPSMNDISIERWNFWYRRSPEGGLYIDPGPDILKLIEEAGEINSWATGTCILKEAARQLIE